MHGVMTMNTLASITPSAPRVLVVDADDDTRLLYHNALRLAGCDVREAADGREALTKALIQPPASLSDC